MYNQYCVVFLIVTMPINILNAVLMFLVQDELIDSVQEDILTDLRDALAKQRSSCITGSGLERSREERYRGCIQHRLNDLEGD